MSVLPALYSDKRSLPAGLLSGGAGSYSQAVNLPYHDQNYYRSARHCHHRSIARTGAVATRVAPQPDQRPFVLCVELWSVCLRCAYGGGWNTISAWGGLLLSLC